MSALTMSGKPRPTLADYAVIAISPALIMTLVGSLVFFLVEIFYQGGHGGRLSFILALFVMAAVCIARISIEQGRGYAAMFALPLGIVVVIAMLRFVQFQGPLAPFSSLVNVGLVALIWWCADKLTWDCTVIDEQQDTSGQGLMQTLGWDSAQVDGGEQTAEGSESGDASRVGSEQPGSPQSRFWDQLSRMRKRPHSPGVWVIYFSLAALPIFGIGQGFISSSDLAGRRYLFQLLVVYLASALGLLLTSSFLGLRRYLRQRSLEMPGEIVRVWLGSGVVMIVALLLFCAFLPRRNPEYSVVQLSWFARSPDNLKPSRWGWGQDGVAGQQDGSAATATSLPPAQSSEQGATSGRNPSASNLTKAENSAQGGQPAFDSSGSSGTSGSSASPASSASPQSGRRSSQDQASGGAVNSQAANSDRQAARGSRTDNRTDTMNPANAGPQADRTSQSASQQTASRQTGSQQPASENAESPAFRANQTNNRVERQPPATEPNLPDSQPSQSQPIQSQPSRSQPGQSQPIQSQPIQSQPSQSQPSQSQPSQSQPSPSQPSPSQPSQSDSPPSPSAQSGPAEESASKSSAESTKTADAQQSRSEGAEGADRESSGSGEGSAERSWPQLSQLTNEVGPLLGNFFQAAYWLVAILVVAFLVWRNWQAVLQAIRQFIESVRGWLWGQQAEQTEQLAERNNAASAGRPFRDFHDPFRTGEAQRMSPDQLVSYSFQALEAWSREQGRPRSPDETPLEFAQAVGRQLQRIAQPALELAELYNWSAYGGGGLPSTARPKIQQFWRCLLTQTPAAAE